MNVQGDVGFQGRPGPPGPPGVGELGPPVSYQHSSRFTLWHCNIFFLINVRQIDSFRDLKDLKGFKVIKDHKGKGFLGQRYFSISSWRIHIKSKLL